MLIVIPTYKRLDRLRWTLLSLMQAAIPQGAGRTALCLANNDAGSHSELLTLVAEIKDQHPNALRWEWLVLKREPTLHPVENWYSAIADFADDDEMVLLTGDDDLLMSWSLVDRHDAAESTCADMLLSESAHGLLFLQDGESLHLSAPMPARSIRPALAEIEWPDIFRWGPAFLGNHCYRYTPLFREALRLSFRWCHEQQWLDWNTRTLMLPYYLPFAIKHLEGNLFGLHQTCVMRGTGAADKRTALYGVPGWNSGFLSLCAYGVLNNEELAGKGELEAARRSLADMFVEWFPTFYFDERISTDVRKETLRRITFPKRWLCSKKVLIGMAAVMRHRLKSSRIRSAAGFYADAVRAPDFLAKMKVQTNEG